MESVQNSVETESIYNKKPHKPENNKTLNIHVAHLKKSRELNPLSRSPNRADLIKMLSENMMGLETVKSAKKLNFDTPKNVDGLSTQLPSRKTSGADFLENLFKNFDKKKAL